MSYFKLKKLCPSIPDLYPIRNKFTEYYSVLFFTPLSRSAVQPGSRLSARPHQFLGRRKNSSNSTRLWNSDRIWRRAKVGSPIPRRGCACTPGTPLYASRRSRTRACHETGTTSMRIRSLDMQSGSVAEIARRAVARLYYFSSHVNTSDAADGHWVIHRITKTVLCTSPYLSFSLFFSFDYDNAEKEEKRRESSLRAGK